jgi:hypothetical protein
MVETHSLNDPLGKASRRKGPPKDVGKFFGQAADTKLIEIEVRAEDALCGGTPVVHSHSSRR